MQSVDVVAPMGFTAVWQEGTLQNSQIIVVRVARSFRDAYAFLSDPTNFPKWAIELDGDMIPLGGRDYLVDVPRGRLVIRFAEINPYGVLDYMTFAQGEGRGPVTPVRLYPNGEGCEMSLTWFQRDGVSDEKFRSDIEWVTSDLTRMKILLEG